MQLTSLVMQVYVQLCRLCCVMQLVMQAKQAMMHVTQAKQAMQHRI